MQKLYKDLIHQSFEFPQEGFSIVNNCLFFYNVPLMEIINKYGTPLRIAYLPKISSQIQKAIFLFNKAMRNINYSGEYIFCYCTKSSHFSFIIDEALKNGAQLETSSASDIDIILNLIAKNNIDKSTYIICNGYKTSEYAQKISELINNGFINTIPILDHKKELEYYDKYVPEFECDLGIRIAASEEPRFEFYTSRLGIRYSDIITFYKDQIQNHPRFKLKMLHFFISTGIKDSEFYWAELNKALNMYCELRKICPHLSILNIGGGFPMRDSLDFEYDYDYMITQIISQTKEMCDNANVPVPDIFSEFGIYTVGESGAMIYSVLGEKQQNDNELWYMINSSLMTTLPDCWGINQRYILLPINKWDKEYQKVNIGGITCDAQDYYNSEVHRNEVYLPKINNNIEPLFIGFFHTGAYQEEISGYGGIKHCLLPSPRFILINKDEKGDFLIKEFAEAQNSNTMLKLLGF